MSLDKTNNLLCSGTRFHDSNNTLRAKATWQGRIQHTQPPRRFPLEACQRGKIPPNERIDQSRLLKYQLMEFLIYHQTYIRHSRKRIPTKRRCATQNRFHPTGENGCFESRTRNIGPRPPVCGPIAAGSFSTMSYALASRSFFTLVNYEEDLPSRNQAQAKPSMSHFLRPARDPR